MSKFLVLSVIVAGVIGGGCATSNRDYSASSLVVDVTDPHSTVSAPAATVHQYNKNSQVVNANATTASSRQNQTQSQVSYVNNENINSVALENNYGSNTQSSSALDPVAANSNIAVSASANTINASDRYQVVKGDTLYSIAFRYGLDYRDLAKKNGIEPPYNIAVGQILALNLSSAKAPEYIVKKGDTLYSIAKANGQSVDFLAGVNDLTAPYTLEVGQKLSLARHNGNSSTVAKVETTVPVAGEKEVKASASSKDTAVKTQKEAKVFTVASTPVVSGKSRTVSGVSWTWPAQGKVVKQFSLAEHGNKGIDIAGTRGQQILAASDGQVVYAGNALRGYGNLVIINHDNEFLSAYAHNDVLLVKEGQKVKRGQQIAKMGSTDASSVGLHFEIRYRGQSVNPIKYLPQ
ncbi:peptidoglycan DD-metalloendopeptidase family protein [Succinatimonas hippei]|uniref:peptidoglycan DD-metalloendopeptidase family protein n=1 Tax=Succinatimonas hippei TaxID=626938 RepID=UPI002011DE86|nr:peptidoglycan DD-metalloendopeptidase family protein [Succinatimonas hippei]MCL1603256.1 peptidoglycan DD-metalloendopeptidase family protein [Succinatimonas hippei]